MNKDQFAYLNIEIEALKIERDQLKEELQNVHKACEAVEKERVDLVHQIEELRRKAYYNRLFRKIDKNT